MPPLNIEIHGAGSRNKGALLMIHAVVRAFEERGVEARFAVDPMEGLAFEDRARLGIRYIYSLRPLLPRRYARSLLEKTTLFTDGFFRQTQLERWGQISRSRCDALIDISGYRYGDYWGLQPAHSFSRLANFYARRRKPVVILPQMLGPFNQPSLRKMFGSIIKVSSLVFARDPSSRGMLDEAYSNSPCLRQAPDITIPLGVCSGNELSESAAIVPNFRVYKTPETGGEKYLVFLQTAFEVLREAGMKPFFLIHESGPEDRALGELVLKRMGRAPGSAIVEEHCPLMLKKKLGRCSVVVSSRFHACVSALSSGVPTLTVGWAHKYEMLHADFGVSEMVLDPNQATDCFPHKLGMIQTHRAQYREQLRDRAMVLGDAVHKMWDEVFDCLEV